MNLIEELAEAKKAALAAGGKTCAACQVVAEAEPGETRDALEDALAGTIGPRRLAEILRGYDIKVGRDAIAKHRKEGHS